MPSVEIVLTVLGPCKDIGGTRQRKCWAQAMSSAEVILDALGSYEGIGGTGIYDVGPKRRHL
jgi:hypothetical protein